MAFSLSASGPSRQGKCPVCALAEDAQANSAALRRLATSASPSTSLTASLLLSRAPLLTSTPAPLAKAYYERSFKLRHALANPISTEFYFKPGSLPLRRFLEAEHATERAYYGDTLAGLAPDLGEVQAEPEVTEFARDHWAKADAERGERSLEREPETELFCLVEQGGKWTFPATEVRAGEGLDEAVNARITGVDGAFSGRTMDTWLVTRKPVGVVRDGDKRNFFLRSHILAGEPQLQKESGYSAHAWLTAEEVEERLRKQGDGALWDSVKGMFGVGAAEEQL